MHKHYKLTLKKGNMSMYFLSSYLLFIGDVFKIIDLHGSILTIFSAHHQWENECIV